MDSEDLMRRPPPPRPYSLPAKRLQLPTSAIVATLELLQAAGANESGLFWYGPRDSAGNGRVEYVVAPQQRMTWGNYHIAAEALAAVVGRLADGWKPLAQVHSHPGVRVEHSNYDDSMVSTRRALSVVFPSYGRAKLPFPAGVGIHEWQCNYWHLLNESEARQRVVVIPGSVKAEDFR